MVFDGNIIRILRCGTPSSSWTWKDCIMEPASLPANPGITFGWITDRLAYSNDHLLVFQKGLGRGGGWVHVWKLEQAREDEGVRASHVYTKSTLIPQGCSSVESVVARDGVFYVVATAELTHTVLQSFDVVTGDLIGSKTIPMPQGPPGSMRPHYVVCEPFLSGNHLWFIRHVEEAGPFPGFGLGLYRFDRATLQQTGFLPCMEEGELWINMPRQKERETNWLLTHCFSDNSSRDSFCKCTINEAGELTKEQEPVVFGSRNEVLLASGNRVIVEHPDEEGEIQFDEYDIETGKKIRTLSTGVPRRDHMVASIQSNGSTTFCIISETGPNASRHVIQPFLA